MINCKDPIEDNVLVLNDFESYLTQKIKIDGKVGNLGQSVTVAKDKDSIVVEAKIAFSKRYLKYLTKKYLKKQQLRDFLRVIANRKDSYELRYFNMAQEEEETE